MVCSGGNPNQLKCCETGTTNCCCILKSKAATHLVTDKCVPCTSWDVMGGLSASSLQPSSAGPVDVNIFPQDSANILQLFPIKGHDICSSLFDPLKNISSNLDVNGTFNTLKLLCYFYIMSANPMHCIVNSKLWYWHFGLTLVMVSGNFNSNGVLASYSKCCKFNREPCPFQIELGECVVRGWEAETSTIPWG